MEGQHNAKHLGDHIGDYQVTEEPIGKGAFAVVFKAQCTLTHKLVAIKRIRVDNISENLRRRVNEEINIHSKLNHPSIIKLFTYFKDTKYIYMVLELCDQDLEAYIRMKPEKRLSETEARTFFSQILEGMLYLKNRNHPILHRDLKLANTLLSGSTVKIADFGLATEVRGKDDIKSTFCGTPNYISPEMISRGPQTKQMDVWSLGVMLYTMLVGRPPFDATCTKETFKNIEDAEYNLKSYLSPASMDLLQKCIQKVPEHRIRLEDIRMHPFLLPMYKQQQQHLESQESDVHAVSVSGNYVQHARLPSVTSGCYDGMHRMTHSAPSSNYHPPLSPPVSMRSNPIDLPRNPYLSNNWSAINIKKMIPNRIEPSSNIASEPSMPSLLPPSAVPRSARSYYSSVRSLESARNPMKAMHYKETGEGTHYPLQRVANTDNGQFSFPDNGYYSQGHNQEEYYADNCARPQYDNRAEEVSHVFSCCSGSRHQSFCERNQNMGRACLETALPTCNAGVVEEIVHIKPLYPVNCQSSMLKSHLGGEGSVTHLSSSLKERPLQLSSLRLKKIREVKEFSILSILENSEVCIEYIKKKSGMRVIEVWKVSTDGNDIVVYRPNGKNGVQVADTPPKEQGDICRYTYDSLPEKHWKKYSNAYIFAENVKAKTRKIIDRNEEPKACLMENGNVEAEFKNGYKFMFFSKHDSRRSKLDAKVSLTKGNHTTTYNVDDCSFEGKDSILYEKCCKVRDHLLGMQDDLTKRQIELADRPQFPCYFGSRPDNTTKSGPKDSTCSQVFSTNKENIRPDPPRGSNRRNLRI